MVKLTVLCGIQCSGKSTWVKEIGNKFIKTIISSDAIRKEFPDYDNEKVFKLVYQRMNESLQNNKDVSDEALYGINGLVSQLYPYQLQYNKLQNSQAEFVDRMLTPVLVVEDGSVDTDDLKEDGLAPGKILVYRNGAKEPKLLYPEINEKFIQNIWTTYDELLNAMHDVYSNFCNDYERGVYNETIN